MNLFIGSPLFKTHCQGDTKSHSDCRNDFFKITFFIIVIHHQPMKSLSIWTTSKFWSHFKTWYQMHSPQSKTKYQRYNKSHSDCRNDFFKITFLIIVIHHQQMKSLSTVTTSQFWSQCKTWQQMHSSQSKTQCQGENKHHGDCRNDFFKNDIFHHFHPSPANEKFVNLNHLPILITIQKMTKHVFTKVQNSVPGWQQESQSLQQWLFQNDIFHHCHPSQANEKFAPLWPPTNSYHKSKQDNNRTHHSPKVSDWMKKRVTVTAEMTF